MPLYIDATVKPNIRIEGTYLELLKSKMPEGLEVTESDIYEHVKDTDKQAKCEVCGKLLGYFNLINPEESSVDFSCLDCKIKYKT